MKELLYIIFNFKSRGFGHLVTKCPKYQNILRYFEPAAMFGMSEIFIRQDSDLKILWI